MTFVLLSVGCLECEEFSTVLGVYDDGSAAIVAFEAQAKEYAMTDNPHFVAGGTCVRADEFGRVQLHDTEKLEKDPPRGYGYYPDEFPTLKKKEAQ
jgi:hypothetical protein